MGIEVAVHRVITDASGGGLVADVAGHDELETEGAPLGPDRTGVDPVAPFAVAHAAAAAVIVQGGHLGPLVEDGGIDEAVEVGHDVAPGIGDVALDDNVLQRAQRVGPGVDGHPVDLTGPDFHLWRGELEGHIAEQGEVPLVGGRPGGRMVLRAAQDVPEALALAHRRIEHDREKGRVELLVGIAVHHAGGGHHGNGPSVGVHHHHLAGGLQLGIIEPGQLAGGREEQRHPIEVVPGADGGRVQDTLVGPAAFAPVADVIDQQGAILHPAVDGLLHLGIALPAWRRHLGVGVHEDALNVVGPVVLLDPFGMADAVEGVAGFRRPAVAVEIVGHETQPVAPGTERVASAFAGQASRRAAGTVGVGVASGVGHHLGHGVPRFGRSAGGDSADADGQRVRQPIRGDITQEAEIVVRDVALRGRVALGTLEGDEQIAEARQVAVAEGAVAEKLQVAGFEGGIAVGPVVQHLHQHLEGGGIHPPRAEAIVNETGLQHGHIQPLGLMNPCEAVRRFPQGRRRDHHEVDLRQRMDVRVLHGTDGHGGVEAGAGARPKPPDGVVGHAERQRAVHDLMGDGTRHLRVGHVPDPLDGLRSGHGPLDDPTRSRFGSPNELLLRAPGHVGGPGAGDPNVVEPPLGVGHLRVQGNPDLNQFRGWDP